MEASTIIKSIHKRIIKSFLDILVLAELRNSPMSGYDVISFIHDKFRLLVSTGTVYCTLYSLERNGLILGTWSQRKRVYKLTAKGEETIKTILSADDNVRYLISNLLKVQMQTAIKSYRE